MDLSTSDAEREPTIDEILFSAMHANTKLSGRMNPKYRLHKGNSREHGECNCTNHTIPSVSRDIIPGQESCGKNVSSSAFSHRTLSKNPNLFSSGRASSQPVAKSASKMTRSVSTPEIDSKYMPKSFSHIKPFALRRMDFSSFGPKKKEIDMLCEKNPFSDIKNTGHRKNWCNEDIPKLCDFEEFTKSSSVSDILKFKTAVDADSPNPFNKYISSICQNSELDSVEKQKQEIAPTLETHRKIHKFQIPKFSNSYLHSRHQHPSKSSDEFHIKNHQTIAEKTPDDHHFEKSHQNSVELEDIQDSKSKMQSSRRLSSSVPSLKLDNSDLITVNKCQYFKLKVLGKGGSSVVYEVFDLTTKENKAIKVVNLDEDEETRISYKNEIKILQKLQYSPRIIKLYDHEETATNLKLVMEAGEIDLSKIIREARHQKTEPISAFTIKHYWQGMLLAVQVIHKEGIIHSDLKPANFLLVKGMLKLIDFGIASSVQQDMTSVFKDSQCGTYNYMSPESLRDVYSGPIINGKADKTVIKMSVKSDVWSLGCILYNLVYGKTPFQHIVKPLQKLAAISNPKTTINFPQVNDKHLLDVMQSCLRFDPYQRPSIENLLSHPYLDGSVTPKDNSKGT